VSRPRIRSLVAVAVALGLLAACGGDDDKPAEASEGTSLVGVFGVAPGACSDGAATGSSFRMVQPGGTLDAGPFVSNGDSTCADQTWTPLVPGTEGGLRTGGYQPQPEVAFGADGASTATAVIAPAPFFAVGFGMSSNETDPQTGTAVPAPSISDDGGVLSGDLSALSVGWNGQHFNQGAPKPGADATPEDLRGTYDPETHAYTLDWSSAIEGGPFDGFTGIWHLEGTFTPA
jgi:hypothetical protein